MDSGKDQRQNHFTFLSAARSAGTVWLMLMVMFSIGRVFYLIDYRMALATEPWSVWEIARALLSALRFDSSVSAFAIAPLFMLAMAAPMLRSWIPVRVVRRIFAGWGCAVSVVMWILVVSDHYFYLYFKDHFNVFFWEFFENTSNTWLVVTGLGDVVPLGVALPVMLAGLIAGCVVSVRASRQVIVPGPAPAGTLSPRLMVPVLVVCAGYLLAARGTLDGRPLTLQDRRVMMTRNSLINLLHTNPVVPLVRGYQDLLSKDSATRTYESDPAKAAALYRDAAVLNPSGRVETRPPGYTAWIQPVATEWSQFLRRRPKHVVVMFMESYARWLIDYPDEEFARTMAGGFLSLRDQGIYFSRHFSPAGGTIKNIAAALYSFPVARDFQPSIVYHREGYKPFPGRLPIVMQKLGYEPRFFYGGVASWHRLYQFLPAVGFSAVFAEHSWPDLPHHVHGIFDGDLFDQVIANLKAQDGPTFSFVMSLTNHPPYNIPEHEQSLPLEIPESLRARLLDDPATFMRRLRAYRYADRSLARFMEQLRTSRLDQETLVIITGDHAFSGGVNLPPEYAWKAEQIPLLIHGPAILKDEWIGRRFDRFTTHLDLLPTLVALVNEGQTFEVESFGRNMFDEDLPAATGINHYFSCLEGTCLKDGLLYRLDGQEWLQKDIQESSDIRDRITALENSYYGAAAHYLYRFDTTTHH